jgi:hypothetical protein
MMTFFTVESIIWGLFAWKTIANKNVHHNKDTAPLYRLNYEVVIGK